MKKGLLMLLLGVFLGAVATLATPGYAAVKQYILTQITYPIVVNGVEYKDAELPILNYEGSTYVPLAKLGDLTGVNYKWNDTLKRVEIGAVPDAVETTPEGATGDKKSTCDNANQKGATLCPDTVIEIPKEPGYKGHADSEDPSYDWAKVMKREVMPPLMSEGWISESMLDKIEGVQFGWTGKPNSAKISDGPQWNETILVSFDFPEDFVSKMDGEITINNIRIKKYYGNFFFNISDLQKTGVIKE